MGSSTQQEKIAHTLSLRCTRQLLDGMTAVVWNFGDNQSLTRRKWDELNDKAKEGLKRKDVPEAPTLIPYSIAITVLQQITDGYVYLDKYLQFMVALEPIDELRAALRRSSAETLAIDQLQIPHQEVDVPDIGPGL